MELIFELSGEKPKIAKAEINGLLEAFSVDYRVVIEITNLLIIKIDKSINKEIFRRLAYTHSVYKKIISSNNLEEIIEYCENIKVDNSYCVRVKRIKNSLIQFKSTELEKKIGASISGSVDLEHPSRLFKLFLSDQMFLLGEKFLEINRKRYRKRKPHKRRFFKPGAIEPKLARAILNLTRTRDGLLLDIFSGTGSFLVEAKDMGIDSIGLDANDEMIKDSRKNFQLTQGDGTISLIRGDSRKLPFKKESFEAIVADPPYGRSSRSYGKLKTLYQKTIEEALRVLEKGGFLCFVSPKRGVDLKVETNEIEEYKVIIHKSLTRIIKLFRR